MATALVAVVAGTLPGAQASGDSTVVVRGGALSSSSRSQLNLVGCDSVFGRTSETIAPTMGVVPGGPAGKRSLGFDPAPGNAIGSVSYVDRVAATTVAGMSVHSDAGTTGVAYVGYQAPKDVGTSLMWIGRASLAAGAASWTSVNVPGLGYVWTQYDMSTHQPIGGAVGSSGVAAFVQARGGDGAGFYAVGFGCDGNAFNTDAWRIGTSTGATTYDFEGYTTSATISGPGAAVEPREPVTLSGNIVDGSGSPVAGRVVLEAQHGDGPWETVDVASGPNPSAVVRPEESTSYRWRFYDRARYEGSVSDPLTVKVVNPPEPGKTASEEPTAEPTEEPTADPSDRPADKPSREPSTPAATEPTQPAPPASTPAPPASTPTSPAASATRDPAPAASQQPSESASQPASDPPVSEQSATAGGAAEAPAG